ncbi:MAG: FAD-dependent oxidoreductase, partial [Jatrophihabitantaceae bacterium]
MSEYDVIVVGLGAMGSAAAYQLARRGQRVLGIEQFTPAHSFGSSHGGSRIVRKAYFEKPDYVPLLVRSYQLWDELSASYGEQLFNRCGALMIGRPDSPVVAGALASAQRWNL